MCLEELVSTMNIFDEVTAKIMIREMMKQNKRLYSKILYTEHQLRIDAPPCPKEFCGNRHDKTKKRSQEARRKK